MITPRAPTARPARSGPAGGVEDMTPAGPLPPWTPSPASHVLRSALHRRWSPARAAAPDGAGV